MNIGPITMFTRMWNEQDLKRSEPETLQVMRPLLSFISGSGCVLESVSSQMWKLDGTGGEILRGYCRGSRS
jgi:hypothetical protein